MSRKLSSGCKTLLRVVIFGGVGFNYLVTEAGADILLRVGEDRVAVEGCGTRIGL